eukprot:407773-Amorphochlora_amoeboformis.AAC.1
MPTITITEVGLARTTAAHLAMEEVYRWEGEWGGRHRSGVGERALGSGVLWDPEGACGGIVARRTLEARRPDS